MGAGLAEASELKRDPIVDGASPVKAAMVEPNSPKP